MVNFHNSKSELTTCEKNDNFDRSKFNNKRCSLRNFKNWTPFNDNQETNESNKTVKDDYLSTTSGIVKRMASSFSSQLLNKSNSNLERPKSNILPSKTSDNLTNESNSITNTHEKIYSVVKSQKSDNNQKVKNESSNNQSHETKNSNLYLKETVNGINIQIQEPHLISVLVNNNNKINQINKTSIKIYPIKIGRTTIGSSDKNDIVINGPGIEPEHCIIENDLKCKSSDNLANKDNIPIINYRRSLTSIFRKKSKDTNLTYSIKLNPLSKLCAVDGVLIESPCGLTSGKNIFFLKSK